MPKFIKHKLTTVLGGGNVPHTFWFLAPQNTYQGLADADTGVTELPTQTGVDKEAPINSVESLLVSGCAVRKVIAYTVGNRRRYAKIIVAKTKVASFAAPNSFRGGTDTKLVNPLDDTFS